MEELALVRQRPLDEGDYVEAVADQNFARKKMLSLEQGMDRLRKDWRQQQEAVLALSSDLKSMVSELDLRRALGLTFQELEARLEDVFQDSNRKCLAMFAKREEVIDLQNSLNKKVNWAEHNQLLKKMSDLRHYVDRMTDSEGGRGALNSELVKKADQAAVDLAMKAKADFSEVSEVRARLERLEVLVTHTDARHSAKLEECRGDFAKRLQQQADDLSAFLSENAKSITNLKQEQAAVVQRLQNAEEELAGVKETGQRILDVEQLMKQRQEDIMTSVAQLRGQLSTVEQGSDRLRSSLQTVTGEAAEFRDGAKQKFSDLSTQCDAFRERLDFLMEATEMMKRKTRENTKSTNSKFTEAADERDKHSTQLAALEKSFKKQEKELRAIEHRVNKAEGSTSMGGAALRLALPAPFSALEGDLGGDPNERLKGIMDQLDRIATSGHPFEEMGVEVDTRRPPLPWSDGTAVTKLPPALGAASTFHPAPPNVAYPAPQAAPPMAGAVRGVHGLSPRPGIVSKSPRRRK
eukprot:TRINITY_DN113062_c0_g1_i1.p1 TRINITY_DN113062_c0_g1~~TRINITY_DN113062_c0_g1_i1.p1  ORF type:complete len:522 (+),score=176.70 TRINITY_DN113062_c0_g1_i1:152-1717(+)